jgi:uncharacterized metal-binding protein YceD (DUF177 family)
MFNIHFSGLSFGHHTFEFHVDDTIFNCSRGEASPAPASDDFFDCHVAVNIDLEKTERFLKLDFTFSGTYSVPCDRCLDPVPIPINQKETLIVNFGNETNFDDEVWVVSSKEHELVWDNYIYETIVLSRPFSAMHKIEDCNPDILAKLQAPPQAKSVDPDPRWEALKALKNAQ